MEQFFRDDDLQYVVDDFYDDFNDDNPSEGPEPTADTDCDSICSDFDDDFESVSFKPGKLSSFFMFYFFPRCVAFFFSTLVLEKLQV